MGVDLALGLLFGLLDRATQIGALIKKAQGENRDLTSAELDTLVYQDDAARARYQAEINKAKAEGR